MFCILARNRETKYEIVVDDSQGEKTCSLLNKFCNTTQVHLCCQYGKFGSGISETKDSQNPGLKLFGFQRVIDKISN